MKRMISSLLALIALLAISTLTGCSGDVREANTNPLEREKVAGFTQEEVEKTVKAWIDDVAAFGPVAESQQPPLVGYCGIRNMGREHIEMDHFERAFKYWGIRMGKVRFTSATSLPDSFFEQHKFQKSAVADKSTATQIGKIQGWRYTLYGQLFSQAPRNSSGDRVLYYDVYLYMLDIQTGEEVWNSRKQFKFVESKPTFGW